jgi:antitoxin component YwqK of YwqJK toxin-antitoxin module
MLNSRSGLMSIRETNPLNVPTDSSLSVELPSQDSPVDRQLAAVNLNDIHSTQPSNEANDITIEPSIHNNPKPSSTYGLSSELLSSIDRFCLENDCPLEVKRTWCSANSYKSDYPSDLIPAIKIDSYPNINTYVTHYYLYSLSDSCKYGISISYCQGQLSQKTMQHKNVLDGPYIRYNENAQIVQEQFFKKGLKYGPDTYYYENGQKESCDYYVNDKLNGRSSEWFSNGQLHKLYRYKNGERSGICQEWHENGQLIKKTHYQHDKEHGLSETWNENGVRTSETYYHRGLKHGVYRFWFINGQLNEESNYVYGRRHGLSRIYYSNGNPREFVNYLYGNRNDIFQTFDENGTLTHQEAYYPVGRPRQREPEPKLEPIFQDRHFLPLPRLEMCALCLEDNSYNPDEEDQERPKELKCNTFAVLRCGHTCCQGCIKGAFRTGRCWTCRKNITPQDVFLCRKWDDSKIQEPIKDFISDPTLLAEILS